MYNTKRMYLLSLLVVFSLFLGGCCEKRPRPPLPSELVMETVDEQELLEDDSVPAYQLTSDQEPYQVMTFDERWSEFQRRLKNKSDVDLVYDAERLFAFAPKNERKKRMELSFFLQTAHNKRGDKEKAAEYAAIYQKLIKDTIQGVEFRKHSSMKKMVGGFGEKWKEDDEE